MVEEAIPVSVWLCIPAARYEAESTVPLWRERGYRTALLRDPGAPPISADLVLVAEYPGYYAAVNRLVKMVLESDPTCNWCVAGGDDVEPDPDHAPEEIADDCSRHFSDPLYLSHYCEAAATFGVMQPTGDRWLEDHYRRQFPDEPAHIDRICGSPWLGREFCTRVYGGRGPFWPEFWHMFGDEHLQAVAKRLGILWQRRDLIHLHRHWARLRSRADDMPEFLKRANSPEEWQRGQELFNRLKAGGFAEANDLL